MANNNHFFPIFEQDGEASAPTGSNSRSKKPAAKRSRQETLSLPHASAVRPTSSPLAIQAPLHQDDSAITSRLDDIEHTRRKLFLLLDLIERHFAGAINDFSNQLDTNTTRLEDMGASLHQLVPIINSLIDTRNALRKVVEVYAVPAP
jgi:hypothetical protein